MTINLVISFNGWLKGETSLFNFQLINTTYE